VLAAGLPGVCLCGKRWQAGQSLHMTDDLEDLACSFAGLNLIGIEQTLDGVQIATNRTTCKADNGAWRSRENIRFRQEQNCTEAMDVFVVVGSENLHISCVCCCCL